MDKPLPSISKPELHRSWNRKLYIGTAVFLVLLVAIRIVAVSRFSAAQGTPSSFPTVTTNSQWKPVVANFDGVEMVLVPSGCFMMGSTQEQIDALNQRHPETQRVDSQNFFNREGPQKRVCFEQPFWLDRYDVTNAQFAHFHGVGASWSKRTSLNQPNQPVATVDQPEADNFCVKRGARLPTEAEWEYAARGPDDLIYPWGNVFVPDNAVYAGNSNHEAADVGSKPGGVSWVGAFDMSGNVWQWTSRDDFFRGDMITNDPTTRKGGAFNHDADFLRSATRGTFDMIFMYGENLLGFRCARSYDANFQPTLVATLAATSAAQGTPAAVPTVTANNQWKSVIQAFDGVEMVLVPPGCFMMGSTDEQINALKAQVNQDTVIAKDNGLKAQVNQDILALANEQPPSRVCFGQPFWLDKTLVTQAQFKQEGGQAAHVPPSVLRGDNVFVDQITWLEARDFCAKRGARLPTEAEWEYTARGPDDLIYPSGNRLYGSGSPSWVGVAIGDGPAEWTSSLYQAFPYTGDDGRENQQDTSSRRVVRGMAWTNQIPYAAPPLEVFLRIGSRAAYRGSEVPSATGDLVSFRCARSYDASVRPTLAATKSATGSAQGTPTAVATITTNG